MQRNLWSRTEGADSWRLCTRRSEGHRGGISGRRNVWEVAVTSRRDEFEKRNKWCGDQGRVKGTRDLRTKTTKNERTGSMGRKAGCERGKWSADVVDQEEKIVQADGARGTEVPQAAKESRTGRSQWGPAVGVTVVNWRAEGGWCSLGSGGGCVSATQHGTAAVCRTFPGTRRRRGRGPWGRVVGAWRTCGGPEIVARWIVKAVWEEVERAAAPTGTSRERPLVGWEWRRVRGVREKGASARHFAKKVN
ncbi:hypothetical protein C8J57DRAFT_1255255 [Mycena rebaudengoi]|nr:hypothetical protein C8J57DRAFT_1255255 [Mycena rebaudengoi]